MMYGMENSLTMILLLIGFILTVYAQANISGNYNKYKKIRNKKGMTGAEAARRVLEKNGLTNIYVVETKGNLTDHYDPTRKVVKLSSDIYNGQTIAAISVAAHECGHAIQDKVGYSFMRIRAALVPFVNLVNKLGYVVLIISVFAGVTGYLKISIFMLLASLLFQLVTLPVEFDASKRAKEELTNLQLIDREEYNGVSNMLKAAAFTYVAGVLNSLLQLLRLIIMLNDRRD